MTKDTGQEQVSEVQETSTISEGTAEAAVEETTERSKSDEIRLLEESIDFDNIDFARISNLESELQSLQDKHLKLLKTYQAAIVRGNAIPEGAKQIENNNPSEEETSAEGPTQIPPHVIQGVDSLKGKLL